MRIDIHVHHHNHDHSVLDKLDQLITLNNIIVATLNELNAKIAELQTVVDTEQQEVANALGALTTEIASLKDQIATGASPADLQASADALTAIIEDVKTTIPNLPAPEPEA